MSTPNLIAAGKYPGILRSVQFADASTGNTQVVMGFEFVDEANQATGQFMSYFGTLTDNSIDFTVEALRNCGWEGDELAELPGLAEAGSLSQLVQLVVVHEDYKGKVGAKIRFVNRSGGGKLKLERALGAEDLKSFSARMRSKVRAAGRDGGQRKPSTNGSNGRGGVPVDQREVPPPSDEDIPFATASIGAEPSAVAAVLRRRV